MGTFFSFLGKLFGLAPRPDDMQAEAMYHQLRNQSLTVDFDQLNLTPAEMTNGVWGVVMDMGHGNATVTLVAMCDGTTSIYFSTGGGIIGAGQHEKPALAAKALVQTAGAFLSSMTSTEASPLPLKDETRFYLLTCSGKMVASAQTLELGMNQHPLSPLFHAGQDVITQIRLIESHR